MKSLLRLLIPCIVVLPGILRAQLPPVEIITNMRFYTNNSGDLPVDKRFGFGSTYTNGADYDKGETDVPGPPPSSFYVLFTDQHIGHNNIKDRSNMDIRGVPDSVQSGSAKNFTLVYEFEMWRNLGPIVSCCFNFGIPRGIDSVNVQDMITGTIFNHTFVNRNGQTDTATIQNDGVSLVKMTVYYNIERHLGVGNHDGNIVLSLHSHPNPVTAGSRLHIDGELPGGCSGLLTDVLGQRVAGYSLGSNPATITVPSHLTAGLYNLSIFSRDGNLLKIMRLPVTR